MINLKYLRNLYNSDGFTFEDNQFVFKDLETGCRMPNQQINIYFKFRKGLKNCDNMQDVQLKK